MIAIVDREPEVQYLYPEFLLFQRLSQRHGIGCGRHTGLFLCLEFQSASEYHYCEQPPIGNL